jgi:hypothetical protein
MTTAPPPARQRFNPRRRAEALPSSYTTNGDTTRVQSVLYGFEESGLRHADLILRRVGDEKSEAQIVEELCGGEAPKRRQGQKHTAALGHLDRTTASSALPSSIDTTQNDCFRARQQKPG